MSEIAIIKQNYRNQLSTVRKQLSAAQRQTYSAKIHKHLFDYLNTMQVRGSLELLAYKALPFEVDTAVLFASSAVQVFVPRMLPDRDMEWVEVTSATVWKKAAFGVLEPQQGRLWQAGDHTTILLCPLLGFDVLGNRLGMGKGYFDRWLGQHQNQLAAQLGLAFSCQELPKVPTEPHDAPLSAIITELGVTSCPIN